MFLEKWKEINALKVAEFLGYFEKQWCVEGRNGWFEGYFPGKPSTSNGLESSHRSIKDNHNGRLCKRLPLKQCFEEMFCLVSKWSRKRSIVSVLESAGETVEVENPNFWEFHHKPIITTQDWTDAYKWQQLDKRVLKIDRKFYIPSKERIIMKKSEAKRYAIQSFETITRFDDFIDFISSFHIVNINLEEWELSTCNCSGCLKNYKCDHVIAISSRLKLYNFRNIAMNVPHERKLRAGRPKVTTEALTTQPIETQAIMEIGIISCGESEIDGIAEQPLAKKSRLENTEKITSTSKKKE
ncbi:hypothetical protein BpHYR1_033395 [Brachionus plicatilis]|uniref:SWIM-type domain-containing protein n=1 Tax=Brachionus plicatilis TaxID=10195 RepID=A0A3M7Q1F8_BRAPC|nr:hypothetical protein BpHYR1_033395 [Brachionus plicatilis]